MRYVNLDAVTYALIQAVKTLEKAGRADMAAMVRGIAEDLQSDLDEVTVDACPFCGERFDRRNERCTW